VRISVRYTVGESDAARPDTSCSPIVGTRRNIETELFPVPRGRHSYESVNFLIRRAWWPCLLPRIKRYQPANSITSNQHRLVPSTFPCLTDRLRVKGIAHKNNTRSRLDVGGVEHNADGSAEGLGGEVVAELSPDNTGVAYNSQIWIFRRILGSSSAAVSETARWITYRVGG
jgi:hypothetical protein